MRVATAFGLSALGALAAGCARSGPVVDGTPAVATNESVGGREIVIESPDHASPLAFRRAGSSFSGAQPGHSVEISDRGAWTFRVAARQHRVAPGQVDRKTSAPFRLETVGVSRGQRTMTSGSAQAAEESRVTIDRGLAIESLTNTRDGIEQSWTFQERPPVDPSATGGAADLVVRVAASGHDFVAATSDGLHFRDPESQLSVRYGAATWIDATGEKTPILPTFAGGQIALVVPHDVVERSKFPAVLDPMVSAYIQVSNVPGWASTNPVVVYAPSASVYGIVWETYLAGHNYGIYTQVVSKTGALVGANVALSPTGAVEPEPTIGFDGTNFQIVWTDDYYHIKGQRISTAGALVDVSPVLIDTSAQELNDVQLAANSSGQSLMVFNFASTVNDQWASKGQFIQNGAHVGSDFIIQDNFVGDLLGESYPVVASDGTNYVVAFSDFHGSGVELRTVSTSAALGPAISLTNLGRGYPQIVFNNGTFFLPWLDTRTGMAYYLYGAFYSAAGGVTGGANGFPIYTANLMSEAVVAFDGGNYLIPFLNNSTNMINSQQVTPAGALFGGVYTAGWTAQSMNPGVASSGLGKSLVAYYGPTQTVRAVIYTSGIDGAPCTVNGDCDNAHCVANFPAGTGSSCCHMACTASDSCHVAQCSTGACTNLPKAQCGIYSACEVVGGGCASPPADTDGDGLADAWENLTNGPGSGPYADYNCDGLYEVGETPLTGATSAKPDIFVYYDYMTWGIEGNTCASVSDCNALGYAHGGTNELCTVNHQCAASCNISHGNADCTARPGNHSTEICQANFIDEFGTNIGSVCTHTHDPEVLVPGALAQVTTAFSGRGYNLHIIRGRAQPHSVVASYRTDAQMTTTCEGASTAAGTAGVGKFAVSVYDLKNQPGSPFPQGTHLYHYGLFSHYSACDTAAHCGACPAAQNPDGSTKNSPIAGESGLAEISGNDFVVSLGQGYSDNGSNPGIFNLASTFMHELGHNLGLHHAGGIDIPCTSTADCIAAGSSATCNASPTLPGYSFCFQSESPEQNYKPNYLTVMNYRYQFSGVLASTHPGGSSPTAQRLDYSTIVLPTGGNTPQSLDQSNVAGIPASDPGLGLSEPAGLGATGSYTADVFSFSDAFGDIPATYAPVLGAVPWSGFGSTLMATNVEADTTCGVDHPCPPLPETGLSIPRLYGHQDWAATWASPASTQFTYRFQCLPYFGDGAPLESIGLTGSDVTSSQGVANATGCTPSPSTNCDTGSATGGSSGWGKPIPARIDVRPGCTNNWIRPSPSTTVSYPGGSCQICGGGYQCFATNTSNFVDPSPATSIVSGVRIQLSGSNCSASSLALYVNSTYVGTISPTETCACNICQAYPVVNFSTGDLTVGIPGWIAGGTNSLTVTVETGSSTCLASAVVTPFATAAVAPAIAYTGGSCTICGGSTYQCFSTNSTTFSDPTPANSVVSEVKVALSGVNCNGSNVTVAINGTTIGVTNPGMNCACGNCQIFAPVSLTAALGIANWNHGGLNTLTLTAASGQTCISSAVVTAVYGTVPVVTYGGALIDATKIDTTRTHFGGQLNVSNAYSDIDGDGYQDLTQQYPMGVMGNVFTNSSTSGTLSGVLTTGQVITGTDRIVVTSNQPACTLCGGYDGDSQPGCWYMSPLGTSCNAVCVNRGGFNAGAATHTGNPICSAVYPEKANGANWIAEECCSTDNNTNWGATGAAPDGTYSNGACHLACACNQ